jgi:hypothetical protein
MYGRATSRSAAMVASRLRNSDACVSAAGARIAVVSLSSPMNVPNPVCGSERLRITGMMSVSSGRKAPIAVLIDSPRPANAVPKPWRFACEAARVSSSNMFRNSSSSTGVLACASAIVSPSWKVSRERPRVTSTYLSPSAERGRTSSVESSGSGPASLSSVRVSTAITVPSSSVLGLIFVTAPTREPPILTSLPTTSCAALGTSASTW